MNFLLGIDLGTSGLKAVLFDLKGNIVGRGYSANRYISIERGAAEQDPESWWQGCCKAIRDALKQRRIAPSKIAAIGVCGFHHCPVFLSKSGTPVRPTIVTHDKRLEESLKDLADSGVLAHIMEQTGSRVTIGHFPPIYHYVLDHEPEVIKASQWIILAKDYLRYKLTGVIATELCDATGTHLIAMPEQEWSEPLCDLLQIQKDKLPEIGRADQICGEVTKKASEQSGLPQGIPVVFGGGDSHCALVGLGIIDTAQIGLVLGTNSTLRVTYRDFTKMKDPPVWVQQHVVPGLFTASASSMAGASVLSWFKEVVLQGVCENVEDNKVYSELDALAAHVEPGCEGLLFLPYLHGERSPFYNPKARASFLSIGHHHGRGHFVRSIMEGVGFSIANNLTVLNERAFLKEVKSIRTGRSGGSFLSTWRKILADILELPLDVVGVDEPGCLGAALLAGVGVGVYRDMSDAVAQTVQIESVTDPDRGISAMYSKKRQVFNRVYQAIEPVLYK